MKILLVTELLPYWTIGGLARHCITLGNHLLKVGHDVHLLGNADFKYNDSVDFTGRFIPGFRLKWSLARKIVRRTGVFPYPLYIYFSRQIADAINKVGEDYDVIHYHGHYPMTANFISNSINFVQTRHDHGTFCPNKHFFRFLDNVVCSAFTPQDCTYCFQSKIGFLGKHLNINWISKWRDDASSSISRRKTIFVSEKAMNLSLKALAIDRTSSIFVIHNFTDTKAILSKIQKQGANRNISSTRNNKVMIASTFQPPKGGYEFLKTCRTKGCSFPITVVGRGDELSIMQSEFKELPLTFLGWLSHKDTLILMSSHQIFVVTSLLEEPCPTTILEAMFLNKPVFALKRGGIPELKKYSLYESQLSLFDSMEELVDGIAYYMANQPVPENVDFTEIDFGACVSKKALEIISVYNS